MKLAAKADAAKRKISISLNRDIAEKIREEAGNGRVSEWMQKAALLRLQARSLARLMAEHGVTLSPEMLAEVDAEWPTDG
jgi:hypothetical protein